MSKKYEIKNRKNECYILHSEMKEFQLPTYLLKVSKSICKIEILNKTGTGFLIKLTRNKIPFYCLMTCEHVIEKKYFNTQTTINFSFNYETEKREISLSEGKRYIKDFSDFKIDGMIIEILQSDNISEGFFLSPNLDYTKGYHQFINKKIFILQYPKEKSLSYSEGIIESNLEDFDFIHKASTDEGSSGSPIILDKTTKVIGIHKQSNTKKNENYGNYIGPIINYIQNDLEPEDNKNKVLIDDISQSSSDDFKIKDKANNIKKNCKPNYNNFLKSKKMIIILLSLIILAIILMIILVFIIKRKNKEDNNNNDEETDQITTIKNTSIINENEESKSQLENNNEKSNEENEEKNISEIINEKDKKTINIYIKESEELETIGNEEVEREKSEEEKKEKTEEEEKEEYKEEKEKSDKDEKNNSEFFEKIKEKENEENQNNSQISNEAIEVDEKEEEYLINCAQSDNDKCVELNELSNQCYKCNEGYELIEGECFTYSFVATYYSDLKNETVSLFNLFDYFPAIKKIKVDDKFINLSFEYIFTIQGFHRVYFYLNKKKIYSLREFFFNSNQMKSITFCPQINENRITNVEKLFYNCSSLVSVNISLFKTENITNFSFMFSDCFSLKEINLFDLNTQNAQTISFMFNNCTSLKSIDLSNFKTEKLILMNDLFNNCNSLTSINLSNFNTQNVKSMSFMFYNCYSLTSIDISHFNTISVEHMNELFNSCILLSSIDVSNFITKNAITMTKMFYNCSSLTSINTLNFNTINVGYMNYMFSDCYSLRSIDVSHFNTQSLIYADNMFSNCYSLEAVSLFSYNDLNGFIVGMFFYCYNLKYIDISRIIITKDVELFHGFNSSGKILINRDSLGKIKNIPFAYITSI